MINGELFLFYSINHINIKENSGKSDVIGMTKTKIKIELNCENEEKISNFSTDEKFLSKVNFKWFWVDENAEK